MITKMKNFIRWGRSISVMEMPLSFEEKCERLGIVPDAGGATDLSPDPMEIASAYCFCNHNKEVEPLRGGYREAAFNRCVASGLPFATNGNVVMEVLRDLVQIRSPYTGEMLGYDQVQDGGGSSSHSNWRWKDSQGNIISLGFTNNALTFTPKRNPE